MIPNVVPDSRHFSFTANSIHSAPFPQFIPIHQSGTQYRLKLTIPFGTGSQPGKTHARTLPYKGESNEIVYLT
jgi:hypothetical protein